MDTKVFELMKGLEHRSFLNYSKELYRFNRSLPLDLKSQENACVRPKVHINKADAMRRCAEPCPLSVIKQTSKKTFPWPEQQSG